MSVLVELRKVVKDYRLGQTFFRALRGVDLAVEDGEFLAITRPSGLGKFTLLHLMGALHRPTQGQVLFEGLDLTVLSSDELALLRNTKIGFVFQQFHLLPRITAWENVALPLIYARVRPAERRKGPWRLWRGWGFCNSPTTDQISFPGAAATRGHRPRPR